jgi:hypothetical protein
MKSRYENEDLRVRQSEFCNLWGCEKLDGSAACMFCPFIKDVLDMADEMPMKLPSSWHYLAIERRN